MTIYLEYVQNILNCNKTFPSYYILSYHTQKKYPCHVFHKTYKEYPSQEGNQGADHIHNGILFK